MTGASYERELCRRFRAGGWAALRCPTSGAATDADLPDVLAGRNATIERARFGPEHHADDADTHRRAQALALEVKSTGGDYASADLAEVRALRRFAQTFGARPALAVRSTQQATPTRTYLVAPDTSSVNFSDRPKTGRSPFAVQRTSFVVLRNARDRMADTPRVMDDGTVAGANH